MHRSVAHAGEDVEVEEVHHAKDQEDAADFGAEDFHRGGSVVRTDAEFQREGDEADVDEVEADDEEVVDGIGEGLVAVKGVHEKDAAVFVEGAGDPDGDGDRNEEVGGVGVDDDVHIRSFLVSCYFCFN